jgi:23S rRNA pseudouridine955/2504/2580 synthase
VIVQEDDQNQRIDNFLVGRLKHVPRSRIYQMIRRGEVRVNGGRIKATRRLKAGEKVRIPPYRASAGAPPAFVGDRQLARVADAIIHEDPGLLVLNKPAGLAVHGGSGLAFGAIEALRKLRPDGRLELIHRLDRETSGCLLIAKKRSVLRRCHELIREGRVDKQYRLLVHGLWPPELTEIDAPLDRYFTPGGERRVRVDASGKPSLTGFEVLEQARNATMLRADLHTGRTHQIRVHAASAGHSIVGDDKYASREQLAADQALGIDTLCLHAERVEVPGIGSFFAEPPDSFQSAWRTLQGG